MFIFSFGTAIVLFGSVLIGMLRDTHASIQAIFVSGFGLGGLCGLALTAYFIGKRDRS